MPYFKLGLGPVQEGDSIVGCMGVYPYVRKIGRVERVCQLQPHAWVRWDEPGQSYTTSGLLALSIIQPIEIPPKENTNVNI